eukprot:scaffold156584_cov19-Tisochrysis_lutea.AAC.5
MAGPPPGMPTLLLCPLVHASAHAHECSSWLPCMAPARGFHHLAALRAERKAHAAAAAARGGVGGGAGKPGGAGQPSIVWDENYDSEGSSYATDSDSGQDSQGLAFAEQRSQGGPGGISSFLPAPRIGTIKSPADSPPSAAVSQSRAAMSASLSMGRGGSAMPAPLAELAHPQHTHPQHTHPHDAQGGALLHAEDGSHAVLPGQLEDEGKGVPRPAGVPSRHFSEGPGATPAATAAAAQVQDAFSSGLGEAHEQLQALKVWLEGLLGSPTADPGGPSSLQSSP